MSLIDVQWRPDAKELRRFGVGMLGVGLLAAGACYGKGHAALALGLGIGCSAAGGLALVCPAAALPVYWAWMGLAVFLGLIVSPIVIAAVFYAVVTPVGLLMRLCGRDVLQLRRREAASYWIDLPPPAEAARYQRQF